MNDELVSESGVVVDRPISTEPLGDATARRVRIIGVASGCGSRDHGCRDGPGELRSLGIFHALQGADDRLCWDQTINPPGPATGPLDAVAQISEVLAKAVRGILAAGNFPLVVGGDHSCAIGPSDCRAPAAPQAKYFLVLLGTVLGALSFRCEAADHPSICGMLPLASQEQAICAAKHYLEAKSEACSGVSGFAFAAEANGSSWLVRVRPTDLGNDKRCTGDTLSISQRTGQLLRWERIATYTDIGAFGVTIPLNTQNAKSPTTMAGPSAKTLYLDY